MGTIKNGVKFSGVCINGFKSKGFAKNGQVVYKQPREVHTETTIFINKAQTLSELEISALDICIKALITNNLYDKIRTFYPMIGSSANSTSYDVKSNNNGVYDIAWYGGLTFSPLGVTGNGSNGYGRIQFNPATVFESSQNSGFTICIGTNIAEVKANFGAYTSPSNAFIIGVRPGATSIVRNAGSYNIPTTYKNYGIFTTNRIETRGTIVQENLINEFAASGAVPNTVCSLFNYSTQTSGCSINRIQTLLIHDGLTDAETVVLQNVINKFEQDLGRKTW